MRRFILSFLIFLWAPVGFAQVQSVGDVTFAVPDGWTYKPGADFGSLTYSSGQNFWFMAVFTPMPSGGDPTTDLKAAWTRIVLAGKDYQGLPPLPYYDINHTVGYPGRRADGFNVNRTTYTRLYVLETGGRFVPVVIVSRDGIMMNATENVANDVIGSVRLAPLKAQPLNYRITVADLAGHWNHGMATSQSYYNQQTGRYEGSTSSFYGAGYDITADGHFTYRMSGMVNSSTVRDQDTGVVELGGGSVVFRGQSHVVRYRFINCQHALDGSTVLTLLPESEQVSAMAIIRDGDLWSRAPKK